MVTTRRGKTGKNASDQGWLKGAENAIKRGGDSALRAFLGVRRRATPARASAAKGAIRSADRSAAACAAQLQQAGATIARLQRVIRDMKEGRARTRQRATRPRADNYRTVNLYNVEPELRSYVNHPAYPEYVFEKKMAITPANERRSAKQALKGLQSAKNMALRSKYMAQASGSDTRVYDTMIANYDRQIRSLVIPRKTKR